MINKFKIFFFILFTFYFITGAQQVFASALPKPPNNLGLVGYWSMNDCSSDKATDFSGSGNTGTLTNFALSGATSNWETAGKRGCSLNFDGTNDYVEIADSSTLDSAGGTSYSYGMWIKTTATGNTVLLEKGDNGFFMLQPNVGGNDLFINTIDLVTGGWTPFRDGLWHHLFVVYDVGANTATLYKDGTSIAVVTTAGGSSANNSTLRIGSRAGAYPIAASMDDIRIYNRALTAPEVTALYGSGSAKIFGAGSDKSAGLVGHWKLDDRTGTSAADSAGTNTGTLTGGPTFTSGRLAGAVTFDGTDDYIDAGTSSAFDFTSAGSTFTVATWVKSSSGGDKQIISKGDGIYSTGGWKLFYFNFAGSDYYQFKVGNQSASATKADSNVWHHIVGVKTATRILIYVDGVVASDQAAASAAAGVSSNLMIGRSGSGAEYFPGSVDDVRIYNTALTAEEVRNLYASGTARPTKINSTTAGRGITSGLVGHWTFDGSKLTSTTATNSVSGGTDGTLTNGPTPTLGKTGQALNFTGATQYVSVPSALSSLSGTTASFSAWVKITATGCVLFGTNTGGNIYWQIDGTGNTVYVQTTGVTVPTASTFLDGTWHHFVAVSNGSSSVVYRDGVSVGTGGSGGSIASGAKNFAIGNWIGAPGSSFDCSGAIDDVRIYSTALTAAEVTALYNLGR